MSSSPDFPPGVFLGVVVGGTSPPVEDFEDEGGTLEDALAVEAEEGLVGAFEVEIKVK